MNRAMPSRAATLFALALLLVASVGMWVRSYWRFDAICVLGYGVLSESGEVYSVRWMDGADHYLTGKAGDYGRLELKTGSVHRPWLPGWTWRYSGDRFVSVQWWVVTITIAGLLWCRWRRRWPEEPGFPVVTTP